MGQDQGVTLFAQPVDLFNQRPFFLWINLRSSFSRCWCYASHISLHHSLCIYPVTDSNPNERIESIIRYHTGKLHKSGNFMNQDIQTQTLIIGCGIAGATAALHLSENPNQHVTIITRAAEPMDSNTGWSQGG